MLSEASSSGVSLEEVDDVKEFEWANGEDFPMSGERVGQVFDLMEAGKTAFRENRLEEAIICYSRANNIKPSDPIILSNRCTAYIRICQFVKDRPPSASEYRPSNGLDPTTQAALALKDAEKVVDSQNNSARSYVLKANALILLEKYELAEDAILSGLQVDPLSNSLQGSLRRLSRISASMIERRSHRKPERTNDFDCSLCLKLLYQPVTASCGHSFCRSCLFQSMDQDNRCPLCRTVLFISPITCSVSVPLNNMIQRNFQEEYAERKSEHESLTNFGADLLPLLAVDVVVLLCQRLQLNISAPNDKLMVRRIMEGNRRIGMVVKGSTRGSIADFACEVEITECEPFADGRLLLEVQGRRRFCISGTRNQDGYRVAEVEWIHDICPPDGTRERAELQEMTNSAAQRARSWMTTAKEAAQQDRKRFAELCNAEVMMPTTHDPERFSFWLATLTNRKPPERLELLRIKDTRERIRRGLVSMREEDRRCQYRLR